MQTGRRPESGRVAAAAQGLRDRDPGEDPQASTLRRSEETSPEEQDEEAVEVLEEALRSESVDPEWSKAMEDRIGTFFDTAQLAGSSVRRVDCKSTLCRLDVTHDSTDARKRFVAGVPDMIPPKSTAFGHVEGDDDLEIVVYSHPRR